MTDKKLLTSVCLSLTQVMHWPRIALVSPRL